MLALLAASFVWLVCYRASIQDLHITIFPALFWLAVTAAFGFQVGRLLVFPVVFFYFAVPSWSQLGDPLQHLTVVVMRGFLAVTGPPASICFLNMGTTLPLLARTFPKRTATKRVSVVSVRDSGFSNRFSKS